MTAPWEGRGGFTLIELLIVVVIIGLLAAIAIPKLSGTREKAIIASMRADLRSYATVQESYASDHAGVYGDLADLQLAPYRFVLSGANAGSSSSGPQMWSLTVTNPNSTTTCQLSNGTGATDDGVPSCGP